MEAVEESLAFRDRQGGAPGEEGAEGRGEDTEEARKGVMGVHAEDELREIARVKGSERARARPVGGAEGVTPASEVEGKEKGVATRGSGGGGAGQAEGEGKDGLHRQKMTMECGADGRAEEGVLGSLRLGAERAA